MFSQDILERISAYSYNASHGYWLKCSEPINHENRLRILKIFRDNVQSVINNINGGVQFNIETNNWCNFVKNPNDGLCFKIEMDLCWLTYMIDSDDEDDWVGDADAHLDKIEEQGEAAIDEINDVLNEKQIRYNLKIDVDSLGGQMTVFYSCQELIMKPLT